MMDALNSWFDPYDRKSRLAPALWCGLPLFVAIALLIPEVGTIWAAVGGLVLYCGGATFLAQIGRDRGKILEPTLHEAWGGTPSVAMLRHRDSRLNALTRSRYRTFLQRAVPELALASPEAERKCPEDADAGYESANSWLLAQTRDHERFALLFRENINYGFRRNAWALKPWAFGLEATAVVVVGVAALDSWTGDLSTTAQAIGVEWWASLVLIVVHALFFAFKVRTGWVRIAAEAYARQLLAACDVLESQRAD